MLLNESSTINITFINEIIKLLDKPSTNAPSQISNCFHDEVFFLCSQKRIVNEKQLKEDIELLGGKLESFFSQEITCIITDEMRFSVFKDSANGAVSNIESNVNLDTGKAFGATSKEFRTSTSACNSLFMKSRSRNMMMAMPKGNQTKSKSSTLNMFSNAKLWGQAIWEIDHFQNFLKQLITHVKKQIKVKSKVKSSSQKSRILNENGKVLFLQKYFIKVENLKRNKYPLYKNLSHYPNIEIAPTSRNGSPFNDSRVFNKKKSNSVKNKLTRNSSDLGKRISISNKVPNNGISKKRSLVKHRYYCQCCNTNFSSYERHAKGPRHQAYIKKKENFQCIFNVLEEYGIKSTLDEIAFTSQQNQLEDSSNDDYSNEASIPLLFNETSRKKPCKALSSLSSDISIPRLDYFGPNKLDCLEMPTDFTKTFAETTKMEQISGIGVKERPILNTQIPLSLNNTLITELNLLTCNEMASNVPNEINETIHNDWANQFEPPNLTESANQEVLNETRNFPAFLKNCLNMDVENVHIESQVVNDNINVTETSCHYQFVPKNVIGLSYESPENTRETLMNSFTSESSDNFELRKNVIDAMNFVDEANEFNNERDDIPLDLTSKTNVQ